MIFNVSEVLADAQGLNQPDFFDKYFLGNDNWYIEEYLGHSGTEAQDYVIKYKKIVSEGMGIKQSEVYMNGSAKWGFSLSPPQKGKEEKLFKPFNDDEKVRKISDIDVAVVSEELFIKYWALYRQSYKMLFESIYNPFVFREIYRGIINEKNVQKIDGCRRIWNTMVTPIKARLKKELMFKHDISFRVYRNYRDFEDYTKRIYSGLKKEN